MSRTTPRESKPISQWWQCRACRYQVSWDEPLPQMHFYHTHLTGYSPYECPNCSAVFLDKLSFSLTEPAPVRLPSDHSTLEEVKSAIRAELER